MEEKRIVLVEDQPDDELLVIRALRKHHIGNEIEVARDGAEALDLLLGQGPGNGDARALPQVVLLDLMLPKVDGFEVLRRLRAQPRTRHLPVVVLTSSDEERDLVESYRFGANSFVQKPVDFHEFSEAVRQLGLYWMLINRVPDPGGL